MEVDNDPAYDTVPMGDVIPVAVFGDHVEQRHARNNKPFKDEYDIRMTELKNRFANICVCKCV